MTDPFTPGGMLVADYQKGDRVYIIDSGEIATVTSHQWQAFSRSWLFRLAGHERPYRTHELTRFL